jgi:Fic family protein
MDTSKFLSMFHDKDALRLKKLSRKQPDADIVAYTELLYGTFGHKTPLLDFKNRPILCLEQLVPLKRAALKLLLSPRDGAYGLCAMEDELAATVAIERIDASRDSVRRILRGSAPKDDAENRIYGLKRGLDFIANMSNEITIDNIEKLYRLAINPYVDKADRLTGGAKYRSGAVYVVSGEGVEHAGLPHKKLPTYMAKLAEFANSECDLDELNAAALIHYYIAFLHPYFDGNGRMARLVHLWYLRRWGYSTAMFISLSSYIEQSRKKYYDAFAQVYENAKISGITDATPFLVYFAKNVYNKLELPVSADVGALFEKALGSGEITEKEKALWQFVLSAYGTREFSTKQLEKDYGDAAYATIRKFVMKFTELDLLHVQAYGNRVKYRVYHTPVALPETR